MAKRWYYVDSSLEKVGPITSVALKSLAENGLIRPDTTLYNEEGTKSFPANTVNGLFDEVEELEPFHSGIIEKAAAEAPPIQPIPSFPVNDPNVSSITPVTKPPVPPKSPLETGIMYPEEFPSIQSVGAPIVQQSDSTNKLILTLCGTICVVFVCLALITGLRSLAQVTKQKNGETLQVSSGPQDNTTSGSASPNSDSSIAKAPRSDWKTNVSGFSFDSEDAPPPAPSSGSAHSQTVSSGTGLAGRFHLDDLSAKVSESNSEDPGSSEDENPFGEGAERVSAPKTRKNNSGTRSIEEIVAEVESSVALIKGKAGSGTGFIILPGIIATNSHVINSEEIADLQVLFPSAPDSKKGPFSPKLLYEDSKRDLAFLQIASKLHDPIPMIQDYSFRRAQKVIVIGNPGRGDGEILENAISEGRLSTQTEIEGQPYYQLSIAVNSGNSGGPVLNDEGEVLGVVTLKASKTEAMAYCCPPDALNDAVEAVKSGDEETIRAHNEQHESLVHLNRGLDKLRAISDVPPSRIPEVTRKGIQDFDEAIRKNPQNGMAFLGRGLFKAVLDDMEGAVADLDQAVQCEPDDKELAQLRDGAKKELENRKRMLAQGHKITRFIVPTIPGGSPSSGRGVPGDSGSPENTMLREFRYQQILEKEEWTFNGKPLYGKLIGVKDRFKDGVVQFQLKDSDEVVGRYANRFSTEDFDDIRFYVMHQGYSVNHIKKR